MCANFAPATPQQLASFPLSPPDFPYDGEAYPGMAVPVVTNFAPRVWVPACFGLVPAWARDTKIVRSTYNARTETLAEKPSFRNAWARGQLCIVPVAALYEPCYETGRAVRWQIRRQDARPMGIAALWERAVQHEGQVVWSMTMLTVNADGHALFGRLHKPEDEKRAVVILPDQAWGAWLRARSEGEARLLLRLAEPDGLILGPAPREGV